MMQWVAFYTRKNTYFPRTPSEKARLDILAINIKADTRQQAILEAMRIARNKLDGWLFLDIMVYDPKLHDSLRGYELELDDVARGGAHE